MYNGETFVMRGVLLDVARYHGVDDLEAIGNDCASDGVYEFLLSAPPLPITGAVRAAVNALAVK